MRWIAVMLLVAGLALAGSDGAWFPWVNFAGLGLFLCFAALLKVSELKLKN